MKQKGINWADRKDLREATAFCDLLSVSFNIKSAEESAQEYNDYLDSQFCFNCDEHYDNCMCRGNGNYIAEYDDDASYED